MMRRFWLTLTDERLKSVIRTLDSAGTGLGDLAADPEGSAAFFRPLKAALRKAAVSGRPRSLEALSAAEDFAALLEKTFFDMAILKTKPDPAILEALLCLQRACSETGKLLSIRRRNKAAAELNSLCATGRRSLHLAKTSADVSGQGFPQNLKFCSIYSGLDAAFDSLERCAEALFRI
jgi:hypothetical protein